MQDNKKRMPNGDDNPALDWFSHLLSEDGLYPSEDVMIFWNREDGVLQVRDVAVVYRPRKYMKAKGYVDHPAGMMISSLYNNRLFQGSSGNCFIQDWMKYGNKIPPPPHDSESGSKLGFSPDGDFKCFEAWGFVSPEEERRALREFARIRECQWARDRLERMKKETSSIEELF